MVTLCFPAAGCTKDYQRTIERLKATCAMPREERKHRAAVIADRVHDKYVHASHVQLQTRSRGADVIVINADIRRQQFEYTTIKDGLPIYRIALRDGSIEEANLRTGRSKTYKAEDGGTKTLLCRDGMTEAELCGSGRWRWTLLGETPLLMQDHVSPISQGEFIGVDEEMEVTSTTYYSGGERLKDEIYYVQDGRIMRRITFFPNGTLTVREFTYTKFE